MELVQELLATKSVLDNPKSLDNSKLVSIKDDITKQAKSTDPYMWDAINQLVPNEKMKVLLDLRN